MTSEGFQCRAPPMLIDKKSSIEAVKANFFRFDFPSKSRSRMESPWRLKKKIKLTPDYPILNDFDSAISCFKRYVCSVCLIAVGLVNNDF